MTSPSVWKIVWVSFVARMVLALILLLLGGGLIYGILGKERFWKAWDEAKKKAGNG